MSVTLQKCRFYPKRQIIISREPVTVWTWLTPHFTRKSMFLLIAYIIHGQKSNGKALNVILGQKGTKKPKSHISVTGVYINLVDPSFQLENACFCQYFTLPISIRAINRIQNQFSGKKSTPKRAKRAKPHISEIISCISESSGRFLTKSRILHGYFMEC